MKTTKKQITQTKNVNDNKNNSNTRSKRDKFVTILSVEEGDDCTAWYYCSDGNTYYDSMYTYDNYPGDRINTGDYERI